MDSPLPTLAIVAAYLVGVPLARRHMRGREAVRVGPRVMAGYNLGIIALNAWLVREFVAVFVEQGGTGSPLCAGGYCMAVDYGSGGAALRGARACHVFFLSKLLEFADTGLMVLRKKEGQLSFLHLYHHASMPPIWWLGVSYVPGGNSMLSGAVNSAVHVVMYTYFLLAAQPGVSALVRPYRRHVTRLQLAQFFLVFAHSVAAIHRVQVVGDCSFPAWMGYAMLAYLSSMIALFGSFYAKNYRRQRAGPAGTPSRPGGGGAKAAGAVQRRLPFGARELAGALSPRNRRVAANAGM